MKSHVKNMQLYSSRCASHVTLVVKKKNKKQKKPPANEGDIRDADLIPGLGRSPGRGHGKPLQYSCLENPMDRKPGRLQPTGLYGVRHDGANESSTHKVPVIQSSMGSVVCAHYLEETV